MTAVEEAQRMVLTAAARLPAENVRLDECAGRRLARGLRAVHNLPQFDGSSMDGYAVRSADLRPDKFWKGSHGVGCRRVGMFIELKKIGEAYAGKPFHGRIRPGETVQIMTGAKLPAGADAVVMQENVRTAGVSGGIRFFSHVGKGENVRFAGGDFRKGQIFLNAGARIGPSEISAAAALGYGRLPVYALPRVGLMTTGDELVAAGSHGLKHGQIYDANSPGIAATIRGTGARLVPFGIVRDNPALIASRIRAALKSCDALVMLGGISVGKKDFVRESLENCGVKIEFWKIAMKPGKPLAFGVYCRGGNAAPWKNLPPGRQTPILIFALPGNPASARVTFELFVKPALRKMMGDPAPLPKPSLARLERTVAGAGPRRCFVRARMEQDLKTGAWKVSPTSARQESHMLSSMLGANALIEVPENAEKIPAGKIVKVYAI